MKSSGKRHRLTLTDYEELADSKDFVWLGDVVPTVNTKTTWQCRCGHVWEATYNNIKRYKKGCTACAGNKRKTATDYHKVAHENSIKWLGPLPSNTKGKTWWECPEGHRWDTSYYVINKGHGCRICQAIQNGDRCRWSAEQYHELAAERGIFWIGEKIPKSANVKTLWYCPCGCEWRSNRNSITNSVGSGCPACGKVEQQKVNATRRLTPSDYREMARQAGLEWLGPEVKNNRTKTRWRCKNGHVWLAPYDSLQSGQRCPECQDMVNGRATSRPQCRLHERLNDGVLNYGVGRWSIDIALVDEKIAIEYDCAYWHDEKRDRRKNKMLWSRGWHILRIKSREKLPTMRQINTCLQRLRNGDRYQEIILDDWKG